MTPNLNLCRLLTSCVHARTNLRIALYLKAQLFLLGWSYGISSTVLASGMAANVFYLSNPPFQQQTYEIYHGEQTWDTNIRCTQRSRMTKDQTFRSSKVIGSHSEESGRSLKNTGTHFFSAGRPLMVGNSRFEHVLEKDYRSRQWSAKQCW